MHQASIAIVTTKFDLVNRMVHDIAACRGVWSCSQGVPTIELKSDALTLSQESL
jgi:hypothetical protein